MTKLQGSLRSYQDKKATNMEMAELEERKTVIKSLNEAKTTFRLEYNDQDEQINHPELSKRRITTLKPDQSPNTLFQDDSENQLERTDFTDID